MRKSKIFAESHPGLCQILPKKRWHVAHTCKSWHTAGSIPGTDGFVESSQELVCKWLFGVIEQWAGRSNKALRCALNKHSDSESHTFPQVGEKKNSIYSCCLH